MDSPNADQQSISNLGAVAGSDLTQNYPASPDQGGPVPSGGQPSPAAPAAQPKSRLLAIIEAVAKVGSTAMAGIPDQGRPSFVTGLGQGARAEQATSFETSTHRLDNRALANSLGIDYDTLPSTGPAVLDHLTAQTAAQGSASVPSGTHLSGDGETINVPKDTQATRDGQKQMYGMLAPAFGLPPIPPGRDFVPPQLMNMLTNKIHGYGQDGKPINHDQLPGAIASDQTLRDQLAQSGKASPEQLKALDNRIGVLQANLDALDEHKTDVLKQNEQAKLDVTNNPKNQAAAARGAGMKANAELPSKLALQQCKEQR